jgi:glucokinase
MEKYFIGVDLGGTKISGILVNLQGEIIAKTTVPTLAETGEQAILQRIIDVITLIIAESNVGKENIVAIGFGSPGSLDIKAGKIMSAANLPFTNFDIVKPLQEKFNLPVYIDNDANVAAVGEYLFGAGKGTEHMVFITVSTGIGGGAILNGKIYRGNTCNALEVGHTTVQPDGPYCNCGNYGCAEVLASGTAIAKAAQTAISKGKITSLTTYEKPTAYEVFKEAEKGDSVACNIRNKALTYLGICVANTIMAFDPQKVIIGGGVAQAGSMVFERIDEVVKERCLAIMSENTQVLPASLGTDAGVIGAAALAIMESK